VVEVGRRWASVPPLVAVAVEERLPASVAEAAVESTEAVVE
jgi:hypothetical protein